MEVKIIPIYSKPLIVACNEIAEGSRPALFEKFKKEGLSYTEQTYDKWFLSDTFDVNYYDFEVIVNVCRIPTIFFTNEELSKKVNVKSILPKESWKDIKVDFAKFIIDCYTKCRTKTATLKYLRVERDTVNKFVDNRDDLKNPEITIGRLFGWFKTYHIDKYKYIHDSNMMYTGDAKYDLGELNKMEKCFAAEEPASSYISQFSKEDLLHARLHIENGYGIPDDVAYKTLLWKQFEQRIEELKYDPKLTMLERFESASIFALNQKQRIRSYNKRNSDKTKKSN